MGDNVNPFGQPGQQPNATTDNGVTPSPFGQTPAQSAQVFPQPQPTQPVQPTPSTPSMPTPGQTPVGGVTPAGQSAQPFGATNQPGGATPAPSATFPNTGSTPVTPVTPFGSTGMGPMPSPAAPKAPVNKKLIIGIAGGAIALILVVVAVIVFISMNSVSKKDYANASDQLDTFYDINNDLANTSVTSVRSADDLAELEGEVDKSITGLDNAQAELDELGKMKAIKADSEAKGLFDTLNEKYGQYSSSSKDMLNNLKGMMPMLKAMYAASENVSLANTSQYGEYAKAFQAVADAAKETSVSNDELKEVADEVASASQTYADTFSALASGGDYDSSALNRAISSFSSAGSKLDSALSTWDLDNLVSDVSDAYYDLESYLFDKEMELRK